MFVLHKDAFQMSLVWQAGYGAYPMKAFRSKFTRSFL
jgi:hypothetical protein